jgi:DNA-binding HxlR family transcriptional regulator
MKAQPPARRRRAGHDRARSADPSALAEALARVGDRWSLLVVSALLGGPRRFNDLQDDVAGIAPNVLSQRLKHLERERIVLAYPYSSRPPRYAYELTGAGAELAGAMRLLADWGSAGGGDEAAHDECGTAVEARWYCPTCARVVDDDELGELRFV